MNWLKNAKIQNKLFAAFGILLSFTVILATFAIITARNMEEDFVRLLDGPNQRSEYALEAVSELTNIRRCILSMGYAVDEEAAVNTYHQQYRDSAERVVYCLDQYFNSLLNDTFFPEELKEERKLDVLSIKAQFTSEYIPYVEGIYRASLENDKEKVTELVVTTGLPLGDEMSEALKEMSASAQRFTSQIASETQAYGNRTMRMMIIFECLIVVLCVITSILMVNSVKAPIVKIESAVKEISKGNLAYPIRSGYKDELGMLSNHIGDMVDTISMMNKTVKIIDMLDEIIFVTDLEYNILYMNKFAADMYGFDKDLCIGKKCYSVFYEGQERVCDGCPIPDMIPEKDSFPVRIWEQYEEAMDTWLLCRTSIIRWVDGTLAQMSLEKDNTLQKEHEKQQEQYHQELRKAADAAEEASRMKSSFIANMSHEIRTPMNGIIGFSELALDDEIPPKTKDYLSRIKSSAEGLLQIINDILDISKIEAGKISIERVPFDLHEVFKICRSIIEPKAQEKGVLLFCYAEPSIDKMIVGDPTKLRQIIINLMSNAVKFTNYGMIKLLSSVKEAGENKIKIHFEVKDSGIGITKEQISRIFEPFMQADESTTRRYGGTGLGLPITKNMIELMGGELTVDSFEGIGSRFSFDLEFETVTPPNAVLAADSRSSEEERISFNAEILICEDTAMNMMVIKEHLARLGITTVGAANGKEGVDIVARRMERGENPFDLIFMDIHMPIMDGIDAAKRLAEMGNTSPVVALTANVMTQEKEIYKACGMNDCMSKPFTALELRNCLLKYIAPVKNNRSAVNMQTKSDIKLKNKLIKNFLSDNRDMAKSIEAAIQNGDIKLAHRLAHTLKGTSGLVDKAALRDAAYDIERALADGEMDDIEVKTGVLRAELQKALDELALLTIENEPQTLNHSGGNIAEALGLIERLRPLIVNCNVESVDLLDGLKALPGAELLIKQIEDYDFDLAIETLDNIKLEMEAKDEH